MLQINVKIITILWSKVVVRISPIRIISCFQVAIWLKYRYPQYNQPTNRISPSSPFSFLTASCKKERGRRHKTKKKSSLGCSRLEVVLNSCIQLRTTWYVLWKYLSRVIQNWPIALRFRHTPPKHLVNVNNLCTLQLKQLWVYSWIDNINRSMFIYCDNIFLKCS